MNQRARNEKVDELFSAALELGEAQRASFLKIECAADTDLRVEVESLLIADREVMLQQSDFLRCPPWNLDRISKFALDKDGSQKGSNEPSSGSAAGEPPIPHRIGRYRIDRLLGKGGFGLVYLGYDERLAREVAVKLPHPKLLLRPEDAEAYLNEARTVAKLDNHPNIASVYDMGCNQEFPCYLVTKFVDGTNLARRLQTQPPSWRESAELVAVVAETLHYAHTLGLVHRDVKPGNILLDRTGKPFVVDFGLALREQDGGKGDRYAGTPPYMSPEQARGEGHRVDGRSDIFSLGVVLYELLVGRRPFKGPTHAHLLEQITTLDPKPPRQYEDKIPKELERICLKALAKRAMDRYTTAKDLADDLRDLLGESPQSEPAATAAFEEDPPETHVQPDTTAVARRSEDPVIRIVPKGLRSFDEHDADFFLELLPDPRDREGLPDSIRFWKTRIEERDADKTFSVGLIYGPSGCGKSSLVRAGLMPRLARWVVPVYVQATAADTEVRILKQLRKSVLQLSTEDSLSEACAKLRLIGADRNRKVLMVIDQFEQWLHANPELTGTPLVNALRQCEGGRLQAVVLVRDDFYLPVNRLFRELEIPLLEGHNQGVVDLFDLEHSRKVLIAFGRAYGKLSEVLTAEENAFIVQAVNELAEDNKIISVRLSLFADIMKSCQWIPSSLQNAGGVSGVGVTFLEETFAKTAPPSHRVHQKALRGVLKALLPDAETNIRGSMQSVEQLREASGHHQSDEWQLRELVQILDTELRLITPTDPEGVETESARQAESRYYQLTHDYLVPSIREWLTRKQRETRRGRAEIRLAELSAAWNAKPENRHLPSILEWINISLLTSRQQRTKPQQRMLRSASQLHGFRWSSAVLVAFLGLFALQRYDAHSRHKNLIARTATAVDALQIAGGLHVPYALRHLERLPPEPVVAELRGRYQKADGQRKLTLAYALAQLGEVDHEFLAGAVPTADSGECSNLVTALGNSREAALQAMAAAIVAANNLDDWVAKARLAIVAMHLDEKGPAADMLQFEERPNPIQRTVFIDVFPEWHGDLRELANHLRHADGPALRSGICQAIGSIEEPSQQVRESWQEVLKNWYLNQPDAGTHSAAGRTLRKWKLELPQIQPSGYRETGKDWNVTPSGLTMIRIPAGEFVRRDEMPESKEQTVGITYDFLLSDKEVTVGLFQQFVKDAEYPGAKPMEWNGVREDISPSSKHPVQQVSWYDAVMFCNWLSHNENLRPCYKRTGDTEKIKVGTQFKAFDAWSLVVDASGYRLPKEAEWEYACRAGTTTHFAFGNDEAMLSAYGVFAGNSLSRTRPVGSKLCNAWGLFDMHGNVKEWCDDWFGPYADNTVGDNPSGQNGGSFRVDRGGSWYFSAGFCRSSSRSNYGPPVRSYNLGFRVARVPSPPAQIVGLRSGSP